MSRGIIILLVVLTVFIVIQFIHPPRNESPGNQPADIFISFPATDSVKALVKTACYDCHSNNTRYPWYNNIQPIAWWMDHHIKEGKRELNFSEFATFTAKRQDNKLKKIGEEVKEGEMPLSSYTLIHKDARLTPAQRDSIINWAEGARKLVRK